MGWLDPHTGVDAALALLSAGEPGPGELAWRRVSTRVGNSRYLAQINPNIFAIIYICGNSRNQDPDLMEEVADEQKKEKKMDSVMASWLSRPAPAPAPAPAATPPTTTSGSVKTVRKKQDKSKSLMNNWLKRAEHSDGGDNLHGDGKKLKLGP